MTIFSFSLIFPRPVFKVAFTYWFYHQHQHLILLQMQHLFTEFGHCLMELVGRQMRWTIAVQHIIVGINFDQPYSVVIVLVDIVITIFVMYSSMVGAFFQFSLHHYLQQHSQLDYIPQTLLSQLQEAMEQPKVVVSYLGYRSFGSIVWLSDVDFYRTLTTQLNRVLLHRSVVVVVAGRPNPPDYRLQLYYIDQHWDPCQSRNHSNPNFYLPFRMYLGAAFSFILGFQNSK